MENETNCTLCGKEIEKMEGDLCENCFNVLKQKYPEKKTFNEKLSWIKKLWKKEQEKPEEKEE